MNTSPLRLQNGEPLSPREARERLVENVKLLAMEHGLAGASRISGIKRSTVKSWARRYKWLIPLQNAAQLQIPQPLAVQPAEILRGQLLANKSRSALALSGYLATASEKLNREPNASDLSLTRRAKDLGDLHGRLFPPETQQNQIINVAIVTGQRIIERDAESAA